MAPSVWVRQWYIMCHAERTPKSRLVGAGSGRGRPLGCAAAGAMNTWATGFLRPTVVSQVGPLGRSPPPHVDTPLSSTPKRAPVAYLGSLPTCFCRICFESVLELGGSATSQLLLLKNVGLGEYKTPPACECRALAPATEDSALPRLTVDERTLIRQRRATAGSR